MVILKEKNPLDEMSRMPISFPNKDGLPFRIVINSPDHQPPHAHVMDLKTGKTELGQFEVTKKSPRSSKDIKDYKRGVTDEMRELIFKWTSLPYRTLPKISNWEMLCLTWEMNEK